MRISTQQIYNSNVTTMGQQTAAELKTQQQIATGRRILTPSDDPIASARVLELNQSQSQNTQYQENQDIAKNTLSFMETQLQEVSDVLAYAHERAVQAGNAALSAADRQTIATDLRTQFQQLMGLANSKDANGEYTFSGYKGDTVPFTGSIAGVAYNGDQGQRVLQISPSRLLPVSNNGDEIFMRVPNLNGQFNTKPGTANSGNAIITDGSVVGTYTGGKYGIKFTSATAYTIYDRAADPTMSGAGMASGAYTSGAAINLPPAPAAAQIQVNVAGTPTTGDTFDVDPGGNTDMFTVMQQLIYAMEHTSGSDFQNALQEGIGRLNNSIDNVLKMRTSAGSRQLEVETQQNLSGDLDLQYASRLSELQDLDYAQAIAQLQMQQTSLQAAQQSFVKITGLSLFNFLS